MGDMLVAYEDDVPKNRGLKVSGHCALNTGLGVGNTFAPYCVCLAFFHFFVVGIDSPKAKTCEKHLFPS